MWHILNNKMKKTMFLILSVMMAVEAGFAQQPKLQGDLKELFAGPYKVSVHDAWLDTMVQWRNNERVKLNYNNSEYRRSEFSWLKNTFIYVQMMAYDRYFYDPDARKYTVDRYLNDLKKRYGGIDAVLIWPTYPNIGIDNRNQYDLLADMPGGIEGIKQMILDFKRRGVRVFFPIMFWDHGTRKIALSMPAALMEEMKSIGADGMNGDTMYGVTEDFKNAYDSLGYPVVLQPEVAITDLKFVEWNTSSWGYFWNYDSIPGVSIYKWLEPRHQVFVTNRWVKDKTDDLQYAFFNGIGYNAWENIWGIWNQIPDRYAEAIRRIAMIYHEFPGIWNSAEWEPHISTLHKGMFASRFPGLNKTIYTLVNRDSINIIGRQLKLPYVANLKYFDLWNGIELIPEKEDSYVYLNFPIEAHGFGAVLAIKSTKMNSSYSHFIYKMHYLAKRSLASFSIDWIPLSQKIVPIKNTNKTITQPEGMVLIPSAKDYKFVSNGVMIEGNELSTAVGVQHPWEQHPARGQRHVMNIASFYIDKYPVTNTEFKKFIDATHYRPIDDHNFLKDWKNGTFPLGWGNKPVTWVSIEDARTYAQWAGKRLPHEWEWQYAAQGTDDRLYPWGNVLDTTIIPRIDINRNMRGPTNVNTYPKAASPFGVMDLVGNVWQWTDEYTDDHTCFAILKGGSYFRPQTSDWYFPQAQELNKFGKYLLMAPSIDRSRTIGFRCVVDR
jgi:formylglycine-generating enzyme required for sulfatase activity